jgi:hypothetical protein
LACFGVVELGGGVGAGYSSGAEGTDDMATTSCRMKYLPECFK